MKPAPKVALGFYGVIILACSGLESTDEASQVAPADLTGIWTAMSLPWSGGALVASDETMLLISWGRSPVGTINSQYDAELTEDGWIGMALLRDDEMVVSSYTRGSSSVGLMVLSEDDETYAYMEDLSIVEESAVESARSGERPSGVSGRRGGKGGKGGKRGKGGRGGKGKNR